MEISTNSSYLPNTDVRFSWYDYVFLSTMLVISALIGVYFGIVKKQSTPLEYLLGEKKMSAFPIALSNIASMSSGFALISIPADIYRYGINFWFGVPALALSTMFSYYVYILVFYELQLTSNYEYLEKRFNKKIRIFTSFLFTVSKMMILPILIYIPAMGLSQGIGISVNWITPIISGICIFYTTIGGLKAVVWTDTLQFFIMIGVVFVVLCLGIARLGGLDVVWERSSAMGRLNIDFGIDPTKRDTFWTGFVGRGIMLIDHAGGTNQGVVQKCISLRTYKDVRNSLIIFVAGAAILMSMVILSGLVIFATYFNCDPIANGQVTQPDQIVPYYIMDIAQSLPGLPGVFVAGVLSAALSTLSTMLNSLAATVYTDFVSPFVPKNASNKRINIYLRSLVVVIGVISTCLVYALEHLGSLLPLVFSIGGIFSGPIIGVFTVGMLFPKINSKGALWGQIISLVVILWIVLGAQWYKINGIVIHPSLPSSVEECAIPSSTPAKNSTLSAHEEPFFLYRLSFYYYTLFSSVVVIVVASIVSYFTETDDEPVKRAYLSPLVRHLVPEDCAAIEECIPLRECVKNVK